ncbi:MAG: OsmC family peroxiredoxin, partial [Gammaproteobacteria bacterium]|nr:OsmC family peroxiredoxin [Gammaproteobacteria bacterium]
SLEGDLDVRGMLGLSEKSRKAYNAVRVRMQVKSTTNADTLKELAMFSPVYDIISSALPVQFDLIRV